MRYAIIANPDSGGMALERKRILLGEPSGILKEEIYGLDARNREEFNVTGICPPFWENKTVIPSPSMGEDR